MFSNISANFFPQILMKLSAERNSEKMYTLYILRRYELVRALRNENHPDWVGYWLKRLQVGLLILR